MDVALKDTTLNGIGSITSYEDPVVICRPDSSNRGIRRIQA